VADHVRKQIRSAVETLVTGLTTTGTRVFASRVYPLEAADLPGINLYVEDETVETGSLPAPRGQDRVLLLHIETHAQHLSTLDDQLDTSAKEIEGAMSADITVGGLAKSVDLIGTEFDLTGDANKPTGCARLKYAITYATRENAPDVAV